MHLGEARLKHWYFFLMGSERSEVVISSGKGFNINNILRMAVFSNCPGVPVLILTC